MFSNFKKLFIAVLLATAINIQATQAQDKCLNQNVEQTQVNQLATASLVEAVEEANKTGNFDKVKNLIENGADINQKDKDGNTPLLKALEPKDEDLEKVVQLLNKGDIDALTKAKVTLGNTPLAKYLIENGADVNITNENGSHIGDSPLTRAASDGNEEIVKLLVNKGADINYKDNFWGRTALGFAAANTTHPEIVVFLVKHGADVNSKSFQGVTPLISAAQAALFGAGMDTVKFLLKNGADANYKSPGGWNIIEEVQAAHDLFKNKFFKNKDDTPQLNEVISILKEAMKNQKK